MQLLVVLAALMGVLFSVRAAAVLPVEDRSPVHVNRELSKERKELILKLVSGLLDGALDTNMLPGKRHLWILRSRWSLVWRRGPSTTGYHCLSATAKPPVKTSSGKLSPPANRAPNLPALPPSLPAPHEL
ncbi:hypothetical protein INR49_022420 [Caranx melampygus]|nr:hypothetical protein INR49_022420 [Caranx melampygus]